METAEGIHKDVLLKAEEAVVETVQVPVPDHAEDHLQAAAPIQVHVAAGQAAALLLQTQVAAAQETGPVVLVRHPAVAVRQEEAHPEEEALHLTVVEAALPLMEVLPEAERVRQAETVLQRTVLLQPPVEKEAHLPVVEATHLQETVHLPVTVRQTEPEQEVKRIHLQGEALLPVVEKAPLQAVAQKVSLIIG